MGIKKETANIILNGQRFNIRAIRNNGTKEEIKELSVNLTKAIAFLASKYTGANFSNPLTPEQLETVKESAIFIFDEYPMFSLDEVYLAFKMAAANKFPDISIKTYHGKFHNGILGDILTAYKKYRNNIISIYDRHLDQEKKQIEAEEVEKKNKEVADNVKKRYQKIKEHFDKNGDIQYLEDNVKFFWGEILVNHGVINFDLDKKKEIVKEAKELTIKELNSELNDCFDANRRRELISILKGFHSGGLNDSFKSKWIAKYGKLIVIKSILNNN